MKITIGDRMPNFTVHDILDQVIDSKTLVGKKVYISFLRNTACPLCSFHVFSLLKNLDTLKNANLEIIIFYESKKEVILGSSLFQLHVLQEKKLHVISDNSRNFYDLFGAEVNSQKADSELLRQHGRFVTIKKANALGFNGDGIQESTHANAIPADFLIDENGIVVLAHYGIDAGDNLSLDDITTFANNTLLV